MAEIITKDRKEYNIWDKINGVWNRLNFLTSASSVDASDGKDLQTKVGAINGISSSSTATDENIAASIGYVNQELTELNTNLSNRTGFIDTTNLLRTIDKASASWTATEDCFCVAYANGASGSSAQVYLDDVMIFGAGYIAGFSTPFNSNFYVKKNQTVTTRNIGTYTLRFYALMK